MNSEKIEKKGRIRKKKEKSVENQWNCTLFDFWISSNFVDRIDSSIREII